MFKKFVNHHNWYLQALSSRVTKLIKSQKLRKYFQEYGVYFQDKTGLEIGGPSPMFKSVLPVYRVAQQVDGCNFSEKTIWEGTLESSYNYYVGKAGIQYVLDATNLVGIQNKSYDFVLSCHNLEHLANPLLAISEWLRVLRDDGILLVITPDKRFTFDRKRPYTPFSHLVDDFNNNVLEDDLTHLQEILNYHDLSMDPSAGRNFELFKARSENNFKNRCLHHHVFSETVMREIFNHFRIEVLSQTFIPPYHQIIIGMKSHV